MHLKLSGAGLPNVVLLSGFKLHGEGDAQAVAYEDLDGLYAAIARAIAIGPTPLTGAELRFLRKRFGQSQDQLGALVGKTGQAVAKWEKGQLPVPVAEGTVVRLAWLARHSKGELAGVIARLPYDESTNPPADYRFVYLGGVWTQDDDAAAGRGAPRAAGRGVGASLPACAPGR